MDSRNSPMTSLLRYFLTILCGLDVSACDRGYVCTRPWVCMQARMCARPARVCVHARMCACVRADKHAHPITNQVIRYYSRIGTIYLKLIKISNITPVSGILFIIRIPLLNNNA